MSLLHTNPHSPHPPSPICSAGSIVRPRYIEDEREFGARSVHTVIVYPSPAGWGAATWLRQQLEGNVSSLFDAATFGAVYVRAFSAPYMVSMPPVQRAPSPAPALPACVRRGAVIPLEHAQVLGCRITLLPLPPPRRPC